MGGVMKVSNPLAPSPGLSSPPDRHNTTSLATNHHDSSNGPLTFIAESCSSPPPRVLFIILLVWLTVEDIRRSNSSLILLSTDCCPHGVRQCWAKWRKKGISLSHSHTHNTRMHTHLPSCIHRVPDEEGWGIIPRHLEWSGLQNYGLVLCNPHKIWISYKINSSNTLAVSVWAVITYWYFVRITWLISQNYIPQAQWSVVWCGIVWCVVWYSVVWYGIVWCGVVWWVYNVQFVML